MLSGHAIAHAANGLNQIARARMGVIELAPERLDMSVHRPSLSYEGYIPDIFEELGAGKRLPRVLHQLSQELEFL
jgi:hypothetical protein